MLGTCLKKHLKNCHFIEGRAEVDLSNLKHTSEWFRDKHYNTIIHCAAFTNLEYCEKNQEKARFLHSSVVEILNSFCNKLIYISTVPAWQNKNYEKKIYFETKKSGELLVLKKKANLVIRTNIYGPSNLALWAYKNLIQGRQINGYENSFFNAVHVDQLSCLIKDYFIEKNIAGVHTVSSDKIVSKYSFLKQLAKSLNVDDSLVLPYKNPKNQNLVLQNPDILLSHTKGMELIKNDFKNK